MPEYNLLALFLAGLLGGGHCLGMCSGVVTAFSLQLPAGARWPYHLGFNAGRIAGYALIGALLGTVGSFSVLLQLQLLKTVLFVLAQLLMIALGVYLAGWANWLTRIERLGVPVWQRVQPLLRRALPIRRWPQTLWVGLLWGWLPCGLVYTASITALATASPLKGMLAMLSFGLGTLPNLLLIGSMTQRLQRVFRHRWARNLIGASFVVWALWQLMSFWR
ncbi:sulfite exporter TauE/SafE family protein [Jeongeupia chitinilytica]|uniref:Membrane protein n=1 Tax=Jeongeupia chitinilytica TaxID=1041641 RepID=A0ABQ3GZK7_9NEIS|nr:sulfite exporter TauE/SafE family protein [Jeongeupia chitinilytica]GHD59128.1 membrane protein [Jeongeupia chitinilytica]